MSCVPSIKVKQFANKYKNILKKLGKTETRFDDDDAKFIIMNLMSYSIQTLGIKDAAHFVYNFFPNSLVEKILKQLNDYESKCQMTDCEPLHILNDENFDQEIGSSNKPWLIKFYSTKCSHCVDFQPTWKNVPAVIQGMHVGEIRFEEGRDLVKQYNVQSLPHIMLLKDGKSYALVNGSYTIENIVDFLQHPETYNDRPDDEIDCSNSIKNLIRQFSVVSGDKDYLYERFKFKKDLEIVKSQLTATVSDRKSDRKSDRRATVERP